MADSSDPQQKKEPDELPPSIPLPKTEVAGCAATAGIIVAILVLLLVVGFGLFVGACMR
jgi:hypothetical protein